MMQLPHPQAIPNRRNLFAPDMTHRVFLQGNGSFELSDGGKYIGDFDRFGYKHGVGKETWPNGKVRYEGSYFNGRPHGQGSFYSKNGLGESHGRFCNGKGVRIHSTMTFMNEQILKDYREFTTELYEVSRLLNGEASVIYPNGVTYTGEFREGLRHGRGKETKRCGCTYDGQWLNSMAHGEGKEVTHDGETYEGQFGNHCHHGQGTMISSDGSTYEGQWNNGDRHGRGKETHPCGFTYDGDWYDVVRHGKGFATWLHGATHIGEFRRNVREGYGVRRSSDGSIHMGERRNDQFVGSCATARKFRTSELDVCCICHEDIVFWQKVTMNECMHVFHNGCCKQYLDDQSKCPMCHA